MATTPNRRELLLDHGRVFVEVPQLTTDEELAAVFEAFVKEVRGQAPASARLDGDQRDNQ
jgi:hypothetical protein